MLIAASTAQAQTAGPMLSLEQAILRALSSNAGLTAAAFDLDSARAERAALALRPQFSIGGEVENFAGSGAASSVDQADATLTLGRVIELGRKQELRTELGDAAILLAEIERDSEALGLAAETARRFFDVAVLQEDLALARQAAELAQNTSETVNRLVAAGRTSEAEQMLIDINVAQAMMTSDRLMLALDAARLRLSVLWGAEMPDFAAVAADTYSFETPEPFDSLRAALGQNPALAQLRREAEVVNAQARLAEAERHLDLSATAGLRHLGPTDDVGLVMSISVPIGNRKRAEAGIAGAQARSASLHARSEQRERELGAELFTHYQAQAAARDAFLKLRDAILPAAEQATALYQSGFELGSYSLIELTQAQNQLQELRRKALDAAGQFHREGIEIDYLLGTTTTGPSR